MPTVYGGYVNTYKDKNDINVKAYMYEVEGARSQADALHEIIQLHPVADSIDYGGVADINQNDISGHCFSVSIIGESA
jgi:hypothetical protein